MTVFKLTEEQASIVRNYVNPRNKSRTTPILDADGNWVIGKNLIIDPDYTDIHGQLTDLEEIEFNPIPVELDA